MGRADAECTNKGARVAFQDLVIGVTALHFGYNVLTLNVDHFEMIPNLVVNKL